MVDECLLYDLVYDGEEGLGVGSVVKIGEGVVHVAEPDVHDGVKLS